MSTQDVGDLQGGPPHKRALRRGQDLNRRNHFAQDLGADLCIKRRRLQLLVPEQDLDDADVDLLLKEVSRERVTKAVHRDRLIDSRRRGGSMDRPVELPRGHRIGRIEAGEEPPVWQDLALGMGHPSPGTQLLEQHRREHGVAILAALALLDAQRHALAVDVADLQRDDLACTQPRTIGHR